MVEEGDSEKLCVELICYKIGVRRTATQDICLILWELRKEKIEDILCAQDGLYFAPTIQERTTPCL